MGTITKYISSSGEPRWRARWKIRGANRSRSGFRSHADAKRYLAKIEENKYHAAFGADYGKDLSVFIKDYILLEIDGLSPKTQESYRNIANRLCRTELAAKPMKSVTPDDIKIQIRKWKSAGLSPNSINHYLTFISLMYNHAIKNRQLAYNPLLAVGKLKTVKYEHRILTVEEYNKLLAANEGYYMYLPLVLGGWMGMRRGEVLGLTWKDVDLTQQLLHVRNNRQTVNGKDIIKEPKSATSIRTLAIPDFVAAALRNAKQNTPTNINGFVCTLPDGKPLSANTFTRCYYRALERAGFTDHIRFHDLRHTCAALLTLAGASPKEVSDYLGHSSISITMDLYADIFDTQKKERAKKLNSLLVGEL